MESRVKNFRLLFAAVAFAALATTTSLARHGGGRPAPASGHSAAHHESSGPAVTSEPAANPAGNIAPSLTGAASLNGSGTKKGGGEAGKDAGGKTSGAIGRTGAALHGIDLVRPDDGYASRGLGRRATRSSLIAKSAERTPTIVPPGNVVVHPPTSVPGAPVEFARNAIGVTVPSTSIQNLSIVHPSSGIAVINGTAAKTSIGGNANEIRHENPHPVAIAGPSIYSTGSNGTAMGHPTAGPAELGGPSHTATGIGGASIRPRR
jgi:hypothetical protein